MDKHLAESILQYIEEQKKFNTAITKCLSSINKVVGDILENEHLIINKIKPMAKEESDLEKGLLDEHDMEEGAEPDEKDIEESDASGEVDEEDELEEEE